MKSLSTICCFAAVLCMLVIKADATDQDCPAKFSQHSSKHTACLAPQEGSLKPTKEGVSESDKHVILNQHNGYRRKVEQYNNQPAAKDMQKMYWDDELAMVAQKWASHCIWDHDENNNRKIPGKYSVGQNMAMGQHKWADAIGEWQAEVKDLHFGSGKSGVVGHYTQLVWANTTRVGCGYAECNGTLPFYVCDYAIGGNQRNTKYAPYTAGKKASSCPDFEEDGLCDCQGKVCMHGGTLDLSTCKCNCQTGKPWILKTGECGIDCSMAKDYYNCGRGWNQTLCAEFSNLAYDYCPVMCKLCPADSGKAQPSTTTPSDSGHNLPEKTSAPSQVTTPVPATSAPESTLSPCRNSSDQAKCGQPSYSYYPIRFCEHDWMKSYCPALCGVCLGSECVNYEGNRYQPGQTWRNEYGEFTCTVNGVKYRNGCYVKSKDTVLSAGEQYKYTDGEYLITCKCTSDFYQDCSEKYVGE